MATQFAARAEVPFLLSLATAFEELARTLLPMVEPVILPAMGGKRTLSDRCNAPVTFLGLLP